MHSLKKVKILSDDWGLIGEVAIVQREEAHSYIVVLEKDFNKNPYTIRVSKQDVRELA